MTKNNCIIRFKKHSTTKTITDSARHTFREQQTLNANADITKKNILVGAKTSNDVLNKVNELVDQCESVSKTKPVLMLEYMVTHSHKALNDQDSKKYLNDAYSWIQKKHGRDNVIAAQMHLDEKTPHLCVYVVPRVDVQSHQKTRSVNQKGGGRKKVTIDVPAHKKLSAFHFYNGRDAVSKMQDDFYRSVGSKHGLDRGQKGSKAKHITTQEYAKRLMWAESQLKKPKAKLNKRDHIAMAAGIETENYKLYNKQQRAMQIMLTHNDSKLSAAEAGNELLMSKERQEFNENQARMIKESVAQKEKELNQKLEQEPKIIEQQKKIIDELTKNNYALASQNNELQKSQKSERRNTLER